MPRPAEAPADARPFWPALLWWALYAAAFGYVEALVVVYIRRLAGMPPGLDYPAIWAARHLPWGGAAILGEMRRVGVYGTEYTREIATLLLLLGPAMAAGRTGRERLGLYLFTFAVWDETFYGWLKLWTGFPRSLASTDIYFLMPIAWYGPVWFPVLVVMPALIALALRLLTRPAFLPFDAASRAPARPASAGTGRPRSPADPPPD
jgi:hypothetical protein